MFNRYRISMCFTWFLCQFVFNKRFLKIYCLSVHSFFLVSFTPMYTTLKIISRKFLGVSLIWTFFSHVGAIFFMKQPVYKECTCLLKSLKKKQLKHSSIYIKHGGWIRNLCLFAYSGVQHILCHGYFYFFVPCVASFSELSILYCPFSILYHLFNIWTWKFCFKFLAKWIYCSYKIAGHSIKLKKNNYIEFSFQYQINFVLTSVRLQSFSNKLPVFSAMCTNIFVCT